MINGKNHILLELKHVTKSYQQGKTKVRVLGNVSMQIPHYKMSAIVGPSGSGKSTLLHILGLLDRPDTGSFFFEGRQVEALSSDELASLRQHKIGFVFQDFHLLPHLTALENVTLPFIYRGVSRRKCQYFALEELRRVGLVNWAHHRPEQMSGGQRQRVAIARALVTNPSLVLADEPTGNLDQNSSDNIMQIFIDARNFRNTSIVIVTHDRNVAKQCDSQFTIKDGTIDNIEFHK